MTGSYAAVNHIDAIDHKLPAPKGAGSLWLTLRRGDAA